MTDLNARFKRWAVQGVILNDDGTERGRYTECRFLTRWAARRFQRSLRRDNHYPFRAELWRLTP